MPLMTESVRLAAAGGTLAAYATLCLCVWASWRRRHAVGTHDFANSASEASDARPVVIAFASQTGFGETLAIEAGAALRGAGLPVRVLPIGALTPEDLASARQALFVASTCGEGDPPDNAARFVGKMMASTHCFDSLQYGVLALGDRSYSSFCAFGRSVDSWLRQCGARPRFKRIEVNNGDAEAIAHWRHEIGQFAGDRESLRWGADPGFESWRILDRRLLNPGSSGGETWHIELVPEAHGPLPRWEAGDLVQIAPPDEPDRPRSYSIASVPADGSLHLLVRRHVRPDGSPGISSGSLTQDAHTSPIVKLKIRPHTNFRIGDNTDRPLILIGNGTGLAGLRAHLRARAAAGGCGIWLVFGERNAACDFYYHDEIEHWCRQGLIERHDLAFSRDGVKREYVQHRLAAAADTLREWIARGAAIYVCGDAVGMAPAVDALLTDTIGADGRDDLLASGRYRRDVY